MQKIFCKEHNLELKIPTTEAEFLADSMHENIIQLQLHYKQYPKCKFEEVLEKT